MDDDAAPSFFCAPHEAPSGTTEMAKKRSRHITHDAVCVDDLGRISITCAGTTAATIDTAVEQMKTSSIAQTAYEPLAQLPMPTPSKASQPPSPYSHLVVEDERFGTPKARTTNSRHADSGSASADSAALRRDGGGDDALFFVLFGGANDDEPPPLTYEEMTRPPPSRLKYVALLFTRGRHCSRGGAIDLGGSHLGCSLGLRVHQVHQAAQGWCVSWLGGSVARVG